MKEKYMNSITGNHVDVKPEYMTSIGNNILVYKNHNRIILRGKIDSLKAKIMVFMAELKEKKQTELLNDLKELVAYITAFQRCEVTGEKFSIINILGLADSEIREYSHNPKKYYDVGHLFGLDYNANILVLKLNEIKAFARETEIAAFNAYFEADTVTREDMLAGANRLSSIIYLLELKTISGRYNR